MKMPTAEQARALDFTNEELARLLYPGSVFDTRLPISWKNLMLKYNFDPSGCVVWGYQAWPGGKPLPLTTDAQREIEIIYAAEKRRFR